MKTIWATGAVVLERMREGFELKYCPIMQHAILQTSRGFPAKEKVSAKVVQGLLASEQIIRKGTWKGSTTTYDVYEVLHT